MLAVLGSRDPVLLRHDVHEVLALGTSGYIKGVLYIDIRNGFIQVIDFENKVCNMWWKKIRNTPLLQVK